jgi:hypothetical protein
LGARMGAIGGAAGGASLRLVTTAISSTDCGRIWVPRSHPPLMPPPPHSGPRVTTELSRRAARVLQDACYKAFTIGHGFRVMWTFTLAPEGRTSLLAGKFTLGSEIRRTLNALGAWNDDHGRPRLLDEWVAENPGEVNPQVHLLTDYVSRHRDFREYSAYVESVWSHGYVHQERLRNPKAGAAYILKAVGYISKGTQSGQGRIVGNRYGVSSALRAVKAEGELYDESGITVKALRRCTNLPEGQAYRDLGRGLFATPHGIGTQPWSGLTPEDVAEYLAEWGRW